jgi:hypothetical protein
MKLILKGLTLILLAAAPLSLAAQQPSGPPKADPTTTPAEPDALPLYGARTPGRASSEQWVLFRARDRAVRNVTRPTLTPVLPAPGKATGAAVMVACRSVCSNSGWWRHERGQRFGSPARPACRHWL